MKDSRPVITLITQRSLVLYLKYFGYSIRRAPRGRVVVVSVPL